MIQVIFMDKRKFVNSYMNYKEGEVVDMLRDIRESLRKKENNIIEISRWDDKTKERA